MTEQPDHPGIMCPHCGAHPTKRHCDQKACTWLTCHICGSTLDRRDHHLCGLNEAIPCHAKGATK